MIELTELCGDAADLIGWHRNAETGGMVHDDEIDRWIRKWNLRYIGGVEITGAPDDGLRWTPFYDPPVPPSTELPHHPRLTRTELAVMATAALVTLAWTIALLWFAFGIIDATMNGATTR